MKLGALKQRLKDKKILILGYAREGRSTYRFLRKLFPGKELAIADQKISDDYLAGLEKYDVIFKSPGIPVLAAVKKAQKNGVEVTSQTKLFFELCQGKIVGVTGTKGKSTTASLIHHILKKSGRESVLLGNIGRPPLDYLGGGGRNKIFVFELSSHQLWGLEKSPHIAILLNIFREHLDYYENFEEYVQTKANITRFQKPGEYFIYNNSQELVRKVASKSKAKTLGFSLEYGPESVCYLENDTIIYQAKARKEKILEKRVVRLEGEFNLLNVMAAVIAAKILHVATDNIRQAVKSFKPLRYRLYKVGTFREITFYDDTLATVPEATIAALETLGEEVDTLILGGMDRGQDFRKLAQVILEKKIRNLVFLPTTGKRIWQEIEKAAGKKPNAFFAGNMKSAVKKCFSETLSGKICLLSTASPSFGLFRDYEERSKLFRKYIKLFAG